MGVIFLGVNMEVIEVISVIFRSSSSSWLAFVVVTDALGIGEVPAGAASAAAFSAGTSRRSSTAS